MKIAFFGTPDFTVRFLDHLVDHGLTPHTIITGMDVPVGRKLQLTSPLPKTWADEHDVTCYQPQKLDDDFIEKLAQENYDLFIVIAYGKILPEKLITLPTYGTINVHYSLLPKYRGATPVESAILNGDKTTGVCIQKMVYELDAGDIITSKEITIEDTDTAHTLRDKMNTQALEMCLESIELLKQKDSIFTSQDETQKTICKKIKKQDGLITLDEDPATLDRKYRAYDGWPGIYFFDTKNDKTIRVKIERAHYQKNTFIVERVIPEGRKSMTWQEYQNWN